MELNEPTSVSIRGQRVRLQRRDGDMRAFFAYQGGDYFEFRQDAAAAGRWLLSQSAEDRLHDPTNVVAHGTSIQGAADAFTLASRRTPTGPAYVPTVTQGVDMAAGSIDTLVTILSEAVRLGYHDARHHYGSRPAALIADTLGLVHWNGLQQLQLRHAYFAGREQANLERARATDR